ncbi:MAG TPA: 4-(cytidine 5'-diphospho)-2-C-methyl-D-erythritol kinase [Fervidobacterium sp.]|nr:4-(cytidine 5'-diphospho)-2-C-methyl-D-erythritol kinase [Fervidobacterium sp.]HOM74533.1 4-(cytidine 5'-diphospho)-2-C-methyl-D-erythritol kinase [Fervidobacterium sp.]HPP18134.1 4-(cytidine 5'-diphospho)-2-C-methyl-D-erythritol kinase [Fervidobacterium sp.]HRD20136.1 4-(cytidine 5'-diphospho)-2-C-methyl-D-erythritol kinase [Fervidobacterium sp.]
MGKDGRVVLRTYAKVNLCLDVLCKRSDGFHEIDSLFQNISLYDELDIRFREGSGRLFIECSVQMENNIINKVWQYVKEGLTSDFMDIMDIDVNIDKKIPTGAGLGGGSSNAAGFIYFLKYMDFLDEDKALKIAQMIGSDVPFFLYGGTAIVTGRGEIVKPVKPLTDYSLDLYCPDFSISTKEAYSKLKPEYFGKAPLKAEELYHAYLKRDFETIHRATYNVFEHVIPERLKKDIERLRTLSPSALTGSGSAYFTLRKEGKYEFVEKGVEVYGIEGS